MIALWKKFDSDDRVALVSLLALVAIAVIGMLIYHP